MPRQLQYAAGIRRMKTGALNGVRLRQSAGCPFLIMAVLGLSLRPALAVTAQKTAETWYVYNGSYSGTRFSSLAQITPENVGSLREVARYELPETTSFQSGPIIADDVLFVTTATSTYAVNASNGRLLWSQKYEPKSMGLGTGVRGAAYLGGRLYRGTPGAHLIALDGQDRACLLGRGSL